MKGLQWSLRLRETWSGISMVGKYVPGSFANASVSIHSFIRSFIPRLWCNFWVYLWLILSVLLLFQKGMPQTLSSASMFTSCGFSPHHLHPSKEDDEGGLIFQDGNLTSASLDALIQHLIPTADYYPEVNIWLLWAAICSDELDHHFLQAVNNF